MPVVGDSLPSALLSCPPLPPVAGLPRLSQADVLVAARGGGGLLKERMALARSLWDAGISAEMLPQVRWGRRQLRVSHRLLLITCPDSAVPAQQLRVLHRLLLNTCPDWAAPAQPWTPRPHPLPSCSGWPLHRRPQA